MLRLYTGEYLINPVPLHFSMNECSHRCFYCFANLNQPKRRTDMGSIKRILHHERYRTLESWFLSKGYPILVSNTTDPLAQTNRESFLSIWEAARRKGVRFCYQTKGGKVEDENRIIDDAPTMFYVSLTSDNESFLKEAEPGAPGFVHRLDLIRRAKERGHFVVVGLNPLVPHWWNELPGTFRRLRDMGIGHVWTGELHLSSNKMKVMPERDRERHKADIVYGLKKEAPDTAQKKEATDALISMSFNVFNGTWGSSPDFWGEYFKIFPFMPTMDGFLSHLEKQGCGPVGVTFKYFDRWADIGLPARGSVYGDYVSAKIMRVVMRQLGIDDKQKSISEVHRLWWERFGDVPSPLRVSCLYFGMEPGTGNMYGDSAGLPILIYSKSGGEGWEYELTPDIPVMMTKKGGE